MYFVIFISVSYLTFDTCIAQNPPTISISETYLTARVNGTLVLRCNVDIAYGSSAGFQWQHTDANGIVNLYDISSMVPRVTISEASSFSTYSILTIEHLQVQDSGQIRCRYYYPSGQGSRSVSYDARLCVSDIPVTPPKCSRSFTNVNVILRCITTHCPIDVTLAWRKLSTSTLIIGNATRNTSYTENVLTLLKRDLNNDEEFICTFKSTLYPDVSLNCIINTNEVPTTVPPSSIKTSTYDISTIVPATTSEQIPEISTRTSTIIIVCAVGIGLLLFIGCCVIFACRRKRKRSKDKPDNEDSYTELNITNIKDATYTELKPKEAPRKENDQRDVDDSAEDQGVYVNDWRVKQIQK